MAEESEEKIKIELEVPKSEIQVESISSGSDSEESKEKAAESTKEKGDSEHTVAGYKPSEIAKAPAETPEPEDKRGPNSHQKTVITFGIALALASIALWPLFSFWIFVAVAVAGGAVVAFGSFVRV